MSQKKQLTVVIILALALFTLSISTGLAAKTSESPYADSMVVIGEIDHLAQGYIIRGTKTTGIYTVLNPVPEVLDKYVEKAEELKVSVEIVSSDNVNIVKINGKDYPGK